MSSCTTFPPPCFFLLRMSHMRLTFISQYAYHLVERLQVVPPVIQKKLFEKPTRLMLSTWACRTSLQNNCTIVQISEALCNTLHTQTIDYQHFDRENCSFALKIKTAAKMLIIAIPMAIRIAKLEKKPVSTLIGVGNLAAKQGITQSLPVSA